MTVNVDMVSTQDMTSESWLTRAYTWYTVPGFWRSRSRLCCARRKLRAIPANENELACLCKSSHGSADSQEIIKQDCSTCKKLNSIQEVEMYEGFSTVNGLVHPSKEHDMCKKGLKFVVLLFGRCYCHVP